MKIRLFVCFFVCLFLSLFLTPVGAAEVSRAKVAPIRFSLTMDRVPVSQLVMLFWDQCKRKGLVFDPAVEKLDQVLTIQTHSLTCQETEVVLADSLSRAGVAIVQRNGFDVVAKAEEKDESQDWRQVVYWPRYRDALELAQSAQMVIKKGSFAHQRKNAQVQVSQAVSQVPDIPGNGASLTQKGIDKLVFLGPDREAKELQAMLAKLDVPYPQVELEVSIFEFQRGRSDADAVVAALNLFQSKLGVSVNGGTIQGATQLKLNLPNLALAVDLLDKDTRFRYVARPRVLIRDGEQVSFTAGQDVRVVGQTVVSSSGQATQSITTLTAGLSLTATPHIYRDSVDLIFHQAVSDFAPSPNSDISITRRDLNSRLNMAPGMVYLVAGLKSDRATSSRSGLFGLPLGQAADTSSTELFLLLSVRMEEGIGTQ